MKNLFFGILICLSVGVSAQNKINPAFEESTVVWYGLDFSEARLVGADGFNDPEKIKTFYFKSWNWLTVQEAEKYDIAGYYKKDTRIDKLDVAEKRNESINMSEMITNSDYSFEEGHLEKIVSSYKGTGGGNKLGLVYVVEKFHKFSEMSWIHVVFFNTESGEILWRQAYTSKAGGIAFKNYWAGAIFKTMESSASDFKKARKQHRKRK